MFKGVTKKGKHDGRGEVDSHPPLEPEDMDKIFRAEHEWPPE